MKTIYSTFLFSILASSFVILGIGASSLVFAEDRHGKHMERRFERMASELQLTDDQKSSVQSIVTEQMSKAKSQMSSLHNETRERLSTVLNAEQLEKFDELSEKRHTKMRRHFRNNSSDQ